MTMQAVLYVSHGSRCQEAQAQVAELMVRSMHKVDVPIQEYCFLELAKPTMLEGIFRCIERGATRIAVVPLLLLSAGHAKHDIPKLLKKMQVHFPNIKFTYGRPLGVHDAIIDIVIERMLEKQTSIEKEACILLVGRGSSDPDTKRYFHEIEQQLKRKTAVANITTCYLAACEPDFKTGLASVLDSHAKQVFVIPYLLFTGVLMQRMEQVIAQLPDCNRTVFLCKHLYFHQNIVQLLLERVRETMIAR